MCSFFGPPCTWYNNSDRPMRTLQTAVVFTTNIYRPIISMNVLRWSAVVCGDCFHIPTIIWLYDNHTIIYLYADVSLDVINYKWHSFYVVTITFMTILWCPAVFNSVLRWSAVSYGFQADPLITIVPVNYILACAWLFLQRAVLTDWWKWKMAYDQDDSTAAIYREPMPPQKSCTSYRVWKILSIIYAVIFFVSIASVRLFLFSRSYCYTVWSAIGSRRPSVCLSVTLCVVALRVGVQGS